MIEEAEKEEFMIEVQEEEDIQLCSKEVMIIIGEYPRFSTDARYI